MLLAHSDAALLTTTELLCILSDVKVVLDFITLNTVHWPGRTWTFGVHPPTQTIEWGLLHDSICETGLDELMHTRPICKAPTGVTEYDTI